MKAEIKRIRVQERFKEGMKQPQAMDFKELLEAGNGKDSLLELPE